MKNIIIDFLNDADHLATTPYAAAEQFINLYTGHIHRCRTVDVIEALIANINTDDDDLTITFLSHGNKEWLGMRDNNGVHHTLRYDRLLQLLKKCRTNHRLYLNLLATCESFGIEQSITHETALEEVWVTNLKIPTVRSAFIAIQEEAFDALKDYYNEDEMVYYRKIIPRDL